MRGVRFVFAVAATAMLALARGAAGAQDEESSPPNLDEGITLEEREKLLDRSEDFLPKNSSPDEKLPAELEGEEPDSGAQPKEEKASESEQAGEAPKEQSGASPKESSLPPRPSPASEGVPVSGNPTSGFTAPDGTRVPTGAVSSGGIARLPATGGA